MNDRHGDAMSTVIYIGTLMQTLLNRGFSIRQLGEEAGDEWSISELQQLLDGTDVGVGSQRERVDRTLRCFEELLDGRRTPLHAPESPLSERAGIRRGRPPVGSPRGESPVAKGRVTPAEWEELKEIQAATDRSLSELVRRGVQLVIQEHRAAKDRTSLSDEVRGSFGQRLSLGQLSAQGRQVLWQDASILTPEQGDSV